MKRFHVHVSVSQLDEATRFYSAMFGMPPTVEKSDYAKWMLDEPRLNFAISTRSGKVGVNHLGFQAETNDELEEIHARLQTADTSIAAEKAAECCYATSDKYWVKDPAGIPWEHFRSLDTIPVYGENTSVESEAGAQSSSCGTSCSPTAAAFQMVKKRVAGCCNG